MESEPTRIMVAVNESTIKGYPHASISSRGAFEWTLQKIVRSNTSGFKLLFLHVQVADEDGFDDIDSIYASSEDFKNMKRRDKARGLHLLENFVNKCHEIGVLIVSLALSFFHTHTRARTPTYTYVCLETILKSMFYVKHGSKKVIPKR
ncbi:universal stress protein A-like protein isoform X2 [Morus notabilis]|uniref:universal stress protein A-like protein isoform X2 n=1 Tax=Morus notabilis TaxID=981085 RepID=UPI000CECEDFC|nr:universal stress protein A-like protein isoform X2 [Morus notabilis]